jgi:hypothetical protein
MADEPQREFQGAGGTPGGIGEFAIGLMMVAIGGYLLLNQVTVTTGAWALWGYNAFGLTLVPLLVGIGWLFFDGRAAPGWLLVVLGAAIIFVGIIANLHLFSPDQFIQHVDHARSARRRLGVDRACVAIPLI